MDVIDQPPVADVATDPRMQISAQEKDRALKIKVAVEKDERLRSLSDYEYVEWALTTVGLGLDVICERVYRMQCFREQYRIQDTAVDGAVILCTLIARLLPGYILSFDFLHSSKNYCTVIDCARFLPRQIQSEDDFRNLLGNAFYMYQAAQCDFAAARNGQCMLLECMDSGFHNYETRVVDRWMHDLFLNYPKNDGEYFYLNSPMVMNIFYASIKPFLSERTRKAFRLGHQAPGMEGRRLDSVYNSPSPEAARERTILKVCAHLELRYRNQAAFSLSA